MSKLEELASNLVYVQEEQETTRKELERLIDEETKIISEIAKIGEELIEGGHY